ncbi:MAG: type I glutamate--ammonia ligase [Pseudomonadota bacterium]
MSEQTLGLIRDGEASWVDLRFTDTRGKEQHVSIPASDVTVDFFRKGKMFDGSSIAGWKSINESDMTLLPDDATSVLDPFADDCTVLLRCNVVEPSTMQGYERDPRSLAERAQAYLQTTGIGDLAYFGPEPEFFVFDDVKWHSDMAGASYAIASNEAAWASKESFADGNIGHRPRVKGGYFPVPPVDSLHDIRAAMCSAMEQMGLAVEAHHHEVGTAGQCEIATKYNTLVHKADEVQTIKYCVLNIAHAYGKTATFMPKPVVGDNGSGMHVHQSISRDGVNVFAGDRYAGLSEIALYYIGGIIKHARALNAFTNASTNSYKRLIPGFEAPVKLAYSARNRSAAIRIPYETSAGGRRIEVRFPDPSANPYLAFSAMLMAGLDGIKNKIDPGEAYEQDLYALSSKDADQIPSVAPSLELALDALNIDRDFLIAGDVFTNAMIDGYLDLKQEEVTRLQMTTHPIEFDMYYSV